LPVNPDRRPWAVAIYMVADGPDGDADLDKAALNEIALIRKAGAVIGRHAHVAIQVDLKTKPKIRRQILGRHPTLGPEENAADPATLNGFFKWIQDECPADRHLVIFWGHAEGPVGLFQDTGGRGRSPEVETLSLLELGSAFTHAADLFGRPIDIVLFKDCWFSTLEAVFQLHGRARYALASPGLVVPRYGWPYEEMFRCLRGRLNAKRQTRVVAKKLLAALGAFYGLSRNRRDKSEDPSPRRLQERLDAGDIGRENLRDEVPFALLDASAVGDVAQSLQRFVTALVKTRARAVRREALERASLGDPALLDVTLLCRLIEVSRASTALRRHARTVLRDVTRRLVVAREPQMSTFGGVSAFYFPIGDEDRIDSFIALTTTIADYEKLRLSTMTGWNGIALENVPPQ